MMLADAFFIYSKKTKCPLKPLVPLNKLEVVVSFSSLDIDH
jgi:hypothetical protein